MNPRHPSIRVSFVNNWGESNSSLLRRYGRQTPKCLGRWNDLLGVENPRDADYLIVLGGEPSFTKDLDNSKKIYIKREPKLIQSKTPSVYEHNISWEQSHCALLDILRRQLGQRIRPLGYTNSPDNL